MKINRQKIFEKFGGKCAYCGIDLETIKEMQVDHIIPQRTFDWHILSNFEIPKFLEGVTNVNDERNLFPACRSCNLYKSSNWINQFRIEIERQYERLNNQPMYRLSKRFGIVKDEKIKIQFYFEKILGLN